MALRRLGVQYQHVFSSEIDPSAKQTILANFPPQKFYDDLLSRDNARAPVADLYVAGFPCQPFSVAGLKQGLKDTKGRGDLIWAIGDYLERQQPRAFVLENVANMLTIDRGIAFKQIIQMLEELAGGAYRVVWSILNTKNFGIPQSRSRVYIVGIRRDCEEAGAPFDFPEPVACAPIDLLLDPTDGPPPTEDDLPPPTQGTAHDNITAVLRNLIRAGRDPFTEAWVVDCDSSPGRAKCYRGLSPCMTRSRAAGHWITSRGRRTTLHEMMRLQGMELAQFKQVVSDRQLGQLIGNSMSVNVLERLFAKLLPAIAVARVPRALSALKPSSDGDLVTVPALWEVGADGVHRPEGRSLAETGQAAVLVLHPWKAGTPEQWESSYTTARREGRRRKPLIGKTRLHGPAELLELRSPPRRGSGGAAAAAATFLKRTIAARRRAALREPAGGDGPRRAVRVPVRASRVQMVRIRRLEPPAAAGGAVGAPQVVAEGRRLGSDASWLTFSTLRAAASQTGVALARIRQHCRQCSGEAGWEFRWPMDQQRKLLEAAAGFDLRRPGSLGASAAGQRCSPDDREAPPPAKRRMTRSTEALVSDLRAASHDAAGVVPRRTDPFRGAWRRSEPAAAIIRGASVQLASDGADGTCTEDSEDLSGLESDWEAPAASRRTRPRDTWITKAVPAPRGMLLRQAKRAALAAPLAASRKIAIAPLAPMRGLPVASAFGALQASRAAPASALGQPRPAPRLATVIQPLCLAMPRRLPSRPPAEVNKAAAEPAGKARTPTRTPTHWAVWRRARPVLVGRKGAAGDQEAVPALGRAKDMMHTLIDTARMRAKLCTGR